jgi:hypothetical protein
MTIDANPIVDGNAALVAQNASNASMAMPVDTNTTSSMPTNGAGLPATSNSSTSSFINADGTFTEGWLDRMQGFEDSKQILGQFKDLQGMSKTLISQQRMMGKMKDAVLIPGDNATPEDIGAFHRRMGVPETPESYQAARPNSLAEGTEWNDELGKQFGDLAHKLGMTPSQYQHSIDFFAEQEAQSLAAQAQQIEQERQQSFGFLKQQWGDKYDKNMAVVSRLLQTAGGDINDPGLYSPTLVHTLARIAELYASEDRLVTSDVAATMMVGRARAMDIMKNPDNPMHKRYHSGDREIGQLVTDLIARG